LKAYRFNQQLLELQQFCGDSIYLKVDTTGQISNTQSRYSIFLGSDDEGSTLYYPYHAKKSEQKFVSEQLLETVNTIIGEFENSPVDSLNPNIKFFALRDHDEKSLLSKSHLNQSKTNISFSLFLSPLIEDKDKPNTFIKLLKSLVGDLGSDCSHQPFQKRADELMIELVNNRQKKVVVHRLKNSNVIHIGTIQNIKSDEHIIMDEGKIELSIQDKDMVIQYTYFQANNISYWILNPKNLNLKQGMIWEENLTKKLPFSTIFYPEKTQNIRSNVLTYNFHDAVISPKDSDQSFRFVFAIDNNEVVGIAIAERWSNHQVNQFVDILDIDPTIMLDMKYTTDDNFMNKPLYYENRALMLESTAIALRNANKKLQEHGYCIKIWDAYRPLAIQKEMWNSLSPKERKGYVANPKYGSRHNRGAAVDVTLATLDGKVVEMPTGFDDFSPMAHSNQTTNISKDALKNREILKRAMLSSGFAGIKTEWWHYDGPSRKTAKKNYDFPLKNHNH
jgi:D-alanyl-D-alanine dipeptidase